VSPFSRLGSPPTLPRYLLGAGAFVLAALLQPGTASAAPQQTAVLPAATASAPATILDARLGLHPDKTRFVVELSRPIGFSATAQAPDRILLEIPGAAWAAPVTPTAKGLVRALRLEPAAGALRIVIDTVGPAHVMHSELLPASADKPPRLLIDIAAGAAIPFPVQGRSAAPVSEPAGAPFVDPSPAPVPTPTLKPVVPDAPARGRTAPPTALAAADIAIVPAGIVPAATVTPSAPATLPPAQTASVKIGPDKPAVAGKGAKAPAAKAEWRKMVVIDPGHGGVDPGALAANGTYEKDITLAMARELKRQLEATGRYRVALTRDGDQFIPLRERPARARAMGADLFLSLHADSHDDGAVRGLSVYTLSDTASDREAGMLASRENRSDALGGVNLSIESDQVASILIDLAQRDTMNQSRRFAYTVVQEVGRDTLLLPRPAALGRFAVLTSPDVPAALVELGYLSQPQDFRLLTTPQHQKRLAGGLVRAIETFFRPGADRQPLSLPS